jgi:hypothetical protein
MRRFRLRRLEKVNVEALLIASGHNVKRLLAYGGQRPKKLAQAAALRPPAILGKTQPYPEATRKAFLLANQDIFNRLDLFTPLVHQRGSLG